jgi:SAM-dependent methyltransferase
MSYNYKQYDQFLNSQVSDNNRLLKPFLVDFLDQSGTNIIDIGCGSGYLPQILKSIDFQGKYTGIDIDKNSIDYNQSQNFGQNYEFLSYDDFLKSKVNQTYDLAVFSLTACEMDDQTILNYFEILNVKHFLIVNPSTVTSFYNYIAYKPFLNKILSRLGQTPKWFLKSRVANLEEKYSIRILGQNPNTLGKMYYRTLGDMLNLAKSKNLEFKKYWDLKYTKNSTKTAPISKFEAVLFEKKQ